MNTNDNEFDDLEIAIAFHPADEAAAQLLKENFADEEVFESNAFSGAWIFTIIVSASKGAVGKVFDFLSQHNQRFKGASVKIGKEEISLSGYSLEEVKNFFDSEPFQKALQAVKKA
jgi:uncharacterized membrane protein